MSLRHAILAMLDVEPGTGYDLMTRFQRSVGFFWATSHQQVYKELHGLLEQGAVVCQEKPQVGKPDKKVYSLTEQGADELDAWLRSPVPALKIRDPFLVKLFAGRRLPKSEIAIELARHRTMHRKTLRIYEGLEHLLNDMPAAQRERYLYPRQTLRMGVHYEQAWLNWCAEVAETLELDLEDESN